MSEAAAGGRHQREKKKKKKKKKKKEEEEKRWCRKKRCSNSEYFFKIPKMDGIFHYFNESFVIDPLNDFERHLAWLSKTSLLLKIG